MTKADSGHFSGTNGTNKALVDEFVYEGKKQRVAITVGPNGFIVGANPKTIKE